MRAYKEKAGLEMSTPHALKGVEKDGLTIPLIDFSPFISAQALNAEAKPAAARAIVAAFQTSGFIYLSNHGIDATTLESVFAQSARFFARPDSQKEQLGWTTPEANRGYARPGREKVTRLTDKSAVESLRAENPDLKETYDLGRENDDGGHMNPWPDQIDAEGKGFREVMEGFMVECQRLNMRVMSAIAVGMGLEERHFDRFIDKADNTLRLLHYPPVSRKVFERNEGQVRAGEHSDYGTITLLFQDKRGGLQVRTPKGSYANVTPIEGTVVVNAADLLTRWSNDRIKSTLHRVVEPPKPENMNGDEPDEYPPRYSIAYFCNPNFDAFIEAIPGTFDDTKTVKKYPGINSGDYLVQRLAATF